MYLVNSRFGVKLVWDVGIDALLLKNLAGCDKIVTLFPKTNA